MGLQMTPNGSRAVEFGVMNDVLLRAVCAKISAEAGGADMIRRAFLGGTLSAVA